MCIRHGENQIRFMFFFCVRHGVGMSLRLEEHTLFGGHALCGQKGVTFESLYKIRQYIALKNAASSTQHLVKQGQVSKCI